MYSAVPSLLIILIEPLHSGRVAVQIRVFALSEGGFRPLFTRFQALVCCLSFEYSTHELETLRIS
jgi:hypothetical protein